MKKKCVIVIGMHRSGTSALAAAVQATGFELGEIEEFPKNLDNPKGYFENLEIVNFNDKLLEQLGSSWDVPGFSISADLEEVNERNQAEAAELLKRYYNDIERWVFKDPRMCMLLWFWEPIIEKTGLGELSYVFSIRHPLEVAYSQHKRNASLPDMHRLGHDIRYTLVLWYIYYRNAISSIGDKQVIFVSFQNLLSQPLIELGRLSNFVGETPTNEMRDWFIESFVDKGLNRNKDRTIDAEDMTQSLPFVFSLYEELEVLAKSSAISADTLKQTLARVESKFDKDVIDSLVAAIVEPGGQLYRAVRETNRVQAKCDELTAERDVIRRERDDRRYERDVLRHARDDLKAERDTLEAEIDLMLNSTSWKLTRPVRWLGTMVKISRNHISRTLSKSNTN